MAVVIKVGDVELTIGNGGAKEKKGDEETQDGLARVGEKTDKEKDKEKDNGGWTNKEKDNEGWTEKKKENDGWPQG